MFCSYFVRTGPMFSGTAGRFYIGGPVPYGVTAHGIQIGPLQFDRLEAAPTARCTSRTQGNVGKNTEKVRMADQSSTLMCREEVAERKVRRPRFGTTCKRRKTTGCGIS